MFIFFILLMKVFHFAVFLCVEKFPLSSLGLFNNHVTLGCLCAIFRWLISHVQLSFQPLLVNVLRRLSDSRGDTAVAVWILSLRQRSVALCNY